MEEIRSQTCVKFRNTNKKGARIIQEKEDDGCWSNLGASNGALNIPNNCENSIGHEILHSLGILHEQARTDRDAYLHVNKTGNNFNINPSSSIVSPFEYASSMMYYSDKDLYPVVGDYNNTMGLRQLTFYDIYMVNKLYSCSCPKNLECKNRGYTNPSSCDTCICPDGFTGKLCTELKNDIYSSSIEWKTISRKVKNGTLHEYDYIKPMAGKSLEIYVESQSFYPDYNWCGGGSIEIKYMADIRITNPISCGGFNLYKNIRTSFNDPTVIVYRGGISEATYNIRFRSV
ncbi:unnamed protein product [Caenorhabditis angaria]|uniref:Metalloendopeptidase n=1 Tax=Caenorhabditis angaria TaxID=860376 RepID=A0A9P1N8T8_9PELO|nr:unnamed protein product [Caenorhabditis angaria]